MAAPLLLAPAGSRPAVTAALSAGADAVYVGAGSFGRGGRRAGLAFGEIAEAVAECGAAGAALQVAMNTVPRAPDVPRFLFALRRLRDDGVGTVILNDPGLISLARREIPGFRICASVGVSAMNAAEAIFYREIGADAVVLPTAVPCDEVPAIKAASGLSIEVFVHCRPEFIIHGKCGLTGYARAADADGAGAGAPSAKRGGRCFLVCRELPVPREAYTIEDELDRWVRAGVDAFKVEGRDLPPGRLSALLRRIRARLDAAIAAAGAARPPSGD